MVGFGVLFIPGALATAPQLTGFFELDKNATQGLSTAHVGINQSQVKATDTSIAVCEYTSTTDGATPALTNGAQLMIDGEVMTFTSYGNVSHSTGGCSFNDPNLTVTQVRTYNVTRPNPVSHAGDADITLLTNSGGTANDWSQVYADRNNTPNSSGNRCSDLTGSIACDFVSDPPGITIFTGGSSDIADINTWTCTNQSVPDADEILDAYAAKYANSTTQFLYFGADRFATNGSKDFGFWFFQNPISSSGATITNSCPNGTFSGGNHTVGDILLLGTFTQGGAVGSIRAFKWVASGGDVSTHLLSEGTFGDCVPGSSSANACNTINNTTIPSPWPYQGKTASGSGGAANEIYGGGFMEGGIDLGALGLSGCFSSFMAETRSSPSLTAELKDFTIGKFENCGATVVTTPKDGTGGALTNNSLQLGTGATGVTATDSAQLTVNGTTSFTGTMKFFICGPIDETATCSTGGVPAGSVAANANGAYSSNAVTLTKAANNTTGAPGRYCWRAEWSSTTSGLTAGASDSSATECFHVLPVTPTLSTTAVDCTTSHTATGTTAVPFPGPICDKAALGGTANGPATNGGSDPGQSDNTYASILTGSTASNGALASGSLTFTLAGPDTTSGGVTTTVCTAATVATGSTNPQTGVAVSGNGNYYTSAVNVVTPGAYHWKASYTGDNPNTVSTTHNDNCDDSNEDVTIQQIATTISTAQNVLPQDSATITSSQSGDNIPAGGTVTFNLYGGHDAATNLANCRAGGSTGRIDQESFSTNAAGGNPAPANSETFSTNNTTHAVSDNETVYWYVTYATGDTAHTSRQSNCAESTATTFVNDSGPGTLFP